MKQLHQQVSGFSVTVFSVVNLIFFYSHDVFLPSNVFAPVMMLCITGLAACLVAALGWHAAMEGSPCRLNTVGEPKY
jgi:hypothetical protein